MSANNSVSQNTTPSYGGAGFEPMTYDADTIVPDAYPGAYTGKLVNAKTRLTNKSSKPMLQLEWKLLATDDESDEAQASIQSTVSDWIVISNDKSGNRGKVKLRMLKEKLGLDADIIPTQITSFEDFAPFIEAIKGQEMAVFVTNNTDPDGNVRTNVDYEPRGGQGMTPMAAVADTDEEEAPPAKPAAKAKTNAKPATTTKGGKAKR